MFKMVWLEIIQNGHLCGFKWKDPHRSLELGFGTGTYGQKKFVEGVWGPGKA